MKYSLLFFSFLIAGSCVAATDYTACSEVFNRHGWGYSFYPFEPSKDGKIKAVPGANNFKFNKLTNSYSVEEKIEFQDPYSQKKETNVVVHELKVDQNGNWISYESIDSKAQKKADRLQRIISDNTKGMDVSDSRVTGLESAKVVNFSRKIDFKVLNGSCIPLEGSSSSISISPYVDQDNKIHIKQSPLKTREFNTELCHDVLKFLEKNPDAQSCFDPKINLAIGEIFNKYIKTDDKKFGFGIYGGTGIGIGVNGLPAQNLDAQLTSGFDMKTGKSPVIAAHSILDSCRWNPLTASAFHDKVWESESTAPVKATSASAVPK